MTRPAINPESIRRANRRSWVSFFVLLAACYLFISIVVGVIAFANQLLKGI